MVDTLDQFIKLDIPFLLEERTARVAALKTIMDRADASISEKYRLILEAYQSELDYGRTVQAYEGHLGTGADARTVEFARLGRVTLMYARSTARRRPAGREAGRVQDLSLRDVVEEAPASRRKMARWSC
jgi:hypothetical protein